MNTKVAQLTEKIALEVRDLPEDRLQEVLDSIEFPKQKREEKRRPPRGSPEAILKHAGTWRFEPGEREELESYIQFLREMPDDDRVSFGH